MRDPKRTALNPDGPSERNAITFSPEQAALRKFLSERAAHLEAAYDSLLLLFQGSELPVAAHLAAHLARDLMQILPQALASGSKKADRLRRHFPFSKAFKEIEKAFTPWIDSNAQTVTVDSSAYRCLREQCEAASAEAEKLTYFEFLLEVLVDEVLLPGQTIATQRERALQLEGQWRWFSERAHLRESCAKALAADSLKTMEERFHVVERLLAPLVTPPTEARQRLDQWLKQQDPAGLEQTLAYALAPALAQHFWNNLTNSELVPNLLAGGYFAPSLRQDLEEEGRYRIIPSPSLRALARLTAANPTPAIEAWERTPFSESVDLSFLLDATDKLTGEALRRMATLAVGYITDGMRPYIESKAFNLLSHLLEEKLYNEACCVFDAMTRLGLDESRRPRFLYCDDHDLGERGARPVLLRLGIACAHQCAEILLSRVRYIDKVTEGRWYGLTCIDPDSDNSDWDHAVTVVHLLREMVNHSIESGGMRLDEFLLFLRPTKRIIDQRLNLYFTGRHGDANAVRALLLNQDLIGDYRLINEMANLFRRRFGDLDDQDQQAVISWIKTGPTDEIHAGHEDHWRLCKYSWISDHIDGLEREQFEELRRKFDAHALDLADRSHHGSGIRWGHESPFSHGELEKLPIDEAIKTINAWRPASEHEFRGPSIEGLADLFQALVAKHAREWSDYAVSVGSMKRYYVSRAMNGWLAYAREHSNLNWSAILDLAQRILSQPIEALRDEDDDATNPVILDRDWKWTRACIAELIGQACDHAVDIVFLPRFLGALEAMIDDDPASAIVDEGSFFLRDHGTDALNSARGKVATALCKLAVWIAKSDPDWNANGGDFRGDLHRLVPIFSLIERQLRDRSNANAATWSAYALRANQLRWLAPQWFQREIAGRIMLADAQPGNLAPLAFWLTFLKFQNAHRIWLESMRDSYIATAHWLGTQSKETVSSAEALQDLHEHLMVLYWQGELNLDDGGLLDQIFHNSESSLRGHAMQFIGRSLSKGEAPPPDILQKLKDLWTWYWASYGRDDVAALSKDRHRHSLFGDWIACGHFDPDWALDEFLEYLKRDARADHGEDELKQLVAWLPANPEQVLEACRLMVVNDEDGWRMHLWKDHIKLIVDGAAAIESVAGQRADLLNALILRGHS